MANRLYSTLLVTFYNLKAIENGKTKCPGEKLVYIKKQNMQNEIPTTNFLKFLIQVPFMPFQMCVST